MMMHEHGSPEEQPENELTRFLKERAVHDERLRGAGAIGRTFEASPIVNNWRFSVAARPILVPQRSGSPEKAPLARMLFLYATRNNELDGRNARLVPFGAQGYSWVSGEYMPQLLEHFPNPWTDMLLAGELLDRLRRNPDLPSLNEESTGIMCELEIPRPGITIAEITDYLGITRVEDGVRSEIPHERTGTDSHLEQRRAANLSILIEAAEAAG